MGDARGGLFEDHAGNLWYRSNDLYRARVRDGKLELESTGLILPEHQNQPQDVFQARESADGCIWLNTNRGVVRRLPDGRIVVYQHNTDLRLGGSSFIVEGDRIWVIWGPDFYVIKPPPIESLPAFERMLVLPLSPTSIAPAVAGQRIEFPEKPGEILQLTLNVPGPIIRRLYQTADGHVWLTSSAFLQEFDGRTVRTYGAAQGLPDGLAEMAEDSAGNLWIGGQVLVRPRSSRFDDLPEADGLSSCRLFGINEDAGGTLFRQW